MNPAVVQLILQDSKIAYFITNCDFDVVEFSGAMSLWGNGRQTCLGCSLLDLVPELVGSEAALADILSGELSRFELAWVNRETPQGQNRYLTMVDLPYQDRTGGIAGLVHLMQDVTEMGRLQQQLTQHRNELRLLRDRLARQNLELAAANTELSRLDDMKSQFVSVAAHELRTPLAPIVAYTEMLLDEEAGPLIDQQREYLEAMHGSAQRLLAITDDLLDVTRIEAGRIELVLQPTHLPALIETVASEFAPQLQAKAQRLTLRAPAGLPAALCDENRTAQIIGNLLSNASKYTCEAGLITLSVALAEEDGFLQVSVADNGVGISPEDQAKLFDRFFRAKSADLTQARGAGLGLHISRSLVELHGGRMWLESELGRGSTFRATFPIAETPAEL